MNTITEMKYHSTSYLPMAQKYWEHTRGTKGQVITMKEIQLSQGYVALVDEEDFDRCMAGPKWCADVHRHRDGTIKIVYAIRRIRKEDGTQTSQRMHCFILGIQGVDHEDNNGLNNQKYNLRPATDEQNNRHTRLHRDNTSGYKGVYWSNKAKRWVAQIAVNGKTLYLGGFVDILDARDAYDAAAIKYHGEFALTNAMLAARAIPEEEMQTAQELFLAALTSKWQPAPVGATA